MAWVCDYCGSRAASWSGGQGAREVCSDPGCPSHRPPVQAKTETLTIAVQVNKSLLSDPHDPRAVADLIAQNAAETARKAVLRRFAVD